MAQQPWLTGLSKGAIQPYPPATVNGTWQGVSYIFTRSSYIGIVAGSGGRSAPIYVYLYRGRAASTDYNPGFLFFRYGSSSQFNQYNSGLYGYKSQGEVLGVGGTSSGNVGVNISASTASTFSNSITADNAERRFVYPTTELQRIANQKYSGSADTAERLVASLLAKGYSQLEAQAYLKARDDTERGFVRKAYELRIANELRKVAGDNSPGGGGGSSNPGSTNSSNPGANFAPVSFPNVETRIVVRMPSGFTLPDPGQLSSITKPALNQTFVDSTGKVQSYTYTFDQIPQSIRYNGLGSEWIEIPRAQNFAFVDWNRFQLMKVSMSWIIALDRTEKGGARVHDGLFTNVDSKIIELRRMAQRKYPVTIVNMDDLLSVQLKVESEGGQIRSVKGMQFVITDFNVTAARRTADPNTGRPTSPSKIALAQCEMTLQEIPIESVQIAQLPQLNVPFIPPRTASSSPGDPIQAEFQRLTDIISAPSKRATTP